MYRGPLFSWVTSLGGAMNESVKKQKRERILYRIVCSNKKKLQPVKYRGVWPLGAWIGPTADVDGRDALLWGWRMYSAHAPLLLLNQTSSLHSRWSFLTGVKKQQQTSCSDKMLSFQRTHTPTHTLNGCYWGRTRCQLSFQDVSQGGQPIIPAVSPLISHSYTTHPT